MMSKRRVIQSPTVDEKSAPAQARELSSWRRARLAAGVVLLVVAPLGVLPTLSQDVFVVKAAVASLGILLILTVPSQWSLDRWVVGALALCAVVAGMAMLGAASPSLAFWGRYPRYEGAWMLALYVLAMVAGGRLAGHVALPARWLSVLVPGMAWLVAIIAVVQTRLPGTQRLGSLLANATDLGAFGAVCAVVLVAAAWAQTRPDLRWWLYSGAAAGAVCVAVSGSRASALAVLVSAVLAAVLLRPTLHRVVPVVAAAAAIVLAGALLAVPGLSRVAGGTTAESGSGRVLLWEDTLRLAASHPVLGVGPSGFVDQIGTAHTSLWAAQVGPSNPPDSPHLLPLQILAAGGVLGLLVTAVLVVAVWRPARVSLRDRRAAAILVIIGLVAYVVSVSAEFTSPTLTPVALVGVGWLAARPVRSRQAATAAAVAGALAVTAVLGTALVSESQFGSALEDLTAGDVTAAQKSFSAAHRWAPWNSDLDLREGHAYTVLAQNGAPTDTQCRNATAAASEALLASSEAALDRALCLEAGKDFTAAQATLPPALQHDPTNINLWMESGVLAAESGHLAAAIQSLTTATRLDPTAYEPWQDLAAVYQQTGQDVLAGRAQARAQQLQSQR